MREIRIIVVGLVSIFLSTIVVNRVPILAWDVQLQSLENKDTFGKSIGTNKVFRFTWDGNRCQEALAILFACHTRSKCSLETSRFKKKTWLYQIWKLHKLLLVTVVHSWLLHMPPAQHWVHKWMMFLLSRSSSASRSRLPRLDMMSQILKRLNTNHSGFNFIGANFCELDRNDLFNWFNFCWVLFFMSNIKKIAILWLLKSVLRPSTITTIIGIYGLLSHSQYMVTIILSGTAGCRG